LITSDLFFLILTYKEKMNKLLLKAKVKYLILSSLIYFCCTNYAFAQPGNQWAFFNSPSDKIQCGDLDVTGQLLTVEALIYATAPGGWLVSKHSQPGNLNYLLSAQTGAITNASISFKNTPVCSDMYNRQNAFYHIAMTYDGQYIRHYINGVLRSIVAQTGNMDQNDELLTIGNIAYMNCPNPTDIQCSQPYNGYINEVRIWKEVRSQSQIQQFMAASLPGAAPYNASFPNLLGYYRFNTLNNQATNGTSFNGTLVGGATIGNTLTWTGFPGSYTKTFDPTVTPNQNICNGSSTTLSVSSGVSFNWDHGLGNSASQAVSPAVMTTYNVETISSTGCVDQDQTTVTVTPVSEGGTASANPSTICEGSSASIQLINYTGTIQWQQSADGSNGWADVTSGGSTPNYNTPALKNTTYYRARVKNGVCNTVSSNTALITVNPVSVAGILGGSTTVCSGKNSGSITIGAHTGAITGWLNSDDDFNTSSPVPITSVSLNFSDLTKTTKFKVIVKSGAACPADTSNMVSILVDPKSLAGTLSGKATVCSGSNSGDITLSGSKGKIIGWLSSDDNFVTTTPLSNNTNTLNYTNLTKTTQYKTVVKSGNSCPSDTSLAVTIFVHEPPVGGAIKALPDSVCFRGSAKLSLTGYTGNIQWKESNDGLFYTPVAGANADSLLISNIVKAAFYKAVVSNFNCPAKESSVSTVHVRSTADIKLNIKDTSICKGGAILLIANTGFKNYIWEDDSQQQSHLINKPGTYTVTGTDKNGCSQKGSIVVPECSNHFIPDVFTPNNDNVNEFFFIMGLSDETKLEVYNRWGTLIYSNEKYDNTWSGANVVDGTYFYILNDKKETYTGQVSIIR
jgi:gliding motility-associated-like protein